MNQPLLTVIVPCYNVQKYLDKCITSIVGQTYINLEIILIDDCSKDNTGKICDLWQEKDQRIRVIHKKQNEGLSCARKAGVENAKAEYVTHVDSDDWIDANMYTDMMSALLSTGSDIADCDFCRVYEDGSMKYRVDHHTGSIQVLGRTEGVLIQIKDNCTYRMSFVTKIYKKSLFENFTFPVGRDWGEDQINHELFHRASQTVFIDYAYYYYFQRSDSITRTNSGNLLNDLKNIRTITDLIYDRYCFVEQNSEYHSVLPIVKYMAISSGIFLLRNIIVYPQYFPNGYMKKKMKQIRSIPAVHEYKLRRSIKIEWHILRLNSKLYQLMSLIFVIIIRITNKLKITQRKITHTASDIWLLWNRD